MIITANLSIMLGYWVARLCPAMAFGREWHVVFFAGLLLLVAGMAFRCYSIRVLGRFFTFDVAISEGHTVVETVPQALQSKSLPASASTASRKSRSAMIRGLASACVCGRRRRCGKLSSAFLSEAVACVKV